jgi:hypothetical protein
MKNFMQKFIGILALVFTMIFSVNAQEIGDIYEGGYIFQINEDGTGLVANLEDLGQMTWDEAVSSTSIYTSENYGDWRLPNIDELVLIYNSIANIPECNFFTNKYYWSSTEENNNRAFTVNFTSGNVAHLQKSVSSIRVRPIRSVTFEEDENTEDDTADSFLNLPEGWSMFGYTCLDSVDAMVGFSEISDKIEIVKDEWGLSYLPSWDFNAMGSLQFSEGYQIKMIEEVTNFQFCDAIIPQDGIGQADVDAAYTDGAASVDITSNDEDVAATAYAEGAASVTPEDGVSQADLDALSESYAGWCASDIDNDGICDVDEVSGCMDASSCNYVSAAEFDDSSCEYTSCLDDCGVINGDNSTCLDCAGVVNGTSEDLGCGCGNPQAQEGYDCDGNEIVSLQIGDIHEGGIVFQINEDGTGLVSAQVDLGVFNHTFEWGCYGTSIDGADGTAIGTGYQNTLDIVSDCTEIPIAASLALAKVLEGYDDWYLPSKEELELMYNTIGNGGPEGNIGSFQNSYYWSSSESFSYNAWSVYFGNGYSNSNNFKDNTYRVRVIRAF